MRRKINFETWIVLPTVLLLVISLTILSSLVPNEIITHFLFVIAGIVLFLLTSRIDYRIFIPFSKLIYAIIISLLLLTFLLGETTRGSIRWLQIGTLTIQTSEIIKPLMIVSLALFAINLNFHKPFQILKYAVISSLPVFLVFQQPDLGSALVLGFIAFSIAFARGLPLKTVGLMLIMLVLTFPLFFNILKPYQQDRLRIFSNPLLDPLGSGYSVIQSVIAVGSGKVFGRGLGHGTQSQLRFLPERHTDFIFASLAEELGFIGSILILLGYFALLNSLLNVANNSSDKAGALIVLGFFSMILFQVVVNIGMNVGLLPVTGITLPLISSGGSSLLSVMISLGIAHSVALQKKPIKTIEIH